MDTSFKSHISCVVCLEMFDETSKSPRILSCGHSFCHSCLQKILLQSPCCPTCTASIQFTTVESIPINFSLKSFSSLGLDVGHKVRAEPDYELLKKQISLRLENEMAERKVTADKIQELLIVLKKKERGLDEDLTNCKKQIRELESLNNEGNKICENSTQLQAVIESPIELPKTSNENNSLLKRDEIGIINQPYITPLTIECLESLCNDNVYTVETQRGQILYGKVSVNDGRVWIFSFCKDKPQSRLIPFKELLYWFNRSTELPKTTFLQFSEITIRVPKTTATQISLFSSPKEIREVLRKNVVVVIETDGFSPRAANFTLMCSALSGRSFKGSPIRWFDFGGPLSCGVDNVSPPVTGGISDDDSITPLKEGDVYGMNEKNSWFWIQVKDELLFPSPKFGTVIAGLQDLKEIQGYVESQKIVCSIKESGLVI